MKSLSEKILKITFFWLILIVVVLASVSIVIVNRLSDSDSQNILTLASEKETLKFNDRFSLLENSVTTISEYINGLEEESSSEEDLLSDGFCGKVEEMSLSIARRTDGAMAVYFRYNPELVGNGTQGFFWSRNDSSEEYTRVEPTDILLYDPDDTEHVGWFYEPKENGKAMWMSPYYNQNLDVFMISYVIPYYTKSGDFLGVIGMDIDFNQIVRMAGETSLYETGQVSLADLSAHCLYRADADGDVYSEDLSDILYDSIKSVDVTTGALEMTYNKVRYLTCISQLSNGMRLVLAVPVSEILSQRDYMIMMFAALTVIILVTSIFFIIRFTNRLVYPLKKLTKITKEYAKGNWDATYISKTGDEIQELSESISSMAETTKSYIARINDNAETDALTGLKNKNCYISYIEKYGANGAASSSRYALVLFDINYLKRANDKYGHETGDELIRQASAHICNTFAHSPVFRIGGDEFCAILEDRDYAAADTLCRQFIMGLQGLPPLANDVPVSISYGLARHPEDGSQYDEVFRRADVRMYDLKKAMKASRE